MNNFDVPNIRTMQLYQVPTKINDAFVDLETEAWDGDNIGATTWVFGNIEVEGNIIDLHVEMNVDRLPNITYQAKVKIEPSNRRVFDAITNVFVPSKNEQTPIAERKAIFALSINNVCIKV